MSLGQTYTYRGVGGVNPEDNFRITAESFTTRQRGSRRTDPPARSLGRLGEVSRVKADSLSSLQDDH